MKKMTGVILILCALLSATACSINTTESVASASSDTQTTSASQTDNTSNTSKAETTVQTEQAVESVPEAVPPEEKPQILDINRKFVFEHEWLDGSEKLLVECEYDAILLGSDDAERFPALAAVLADEAAAGESSLKDEYEMFSEAVGEMLDMGMELQEPLVSKSDAQVRRADDVVLSVLTDCRYDNGMNGGHRSFWGSNYDTKTGKTLHLPDIVTDIDEFAQVVEDQLFGMMGKDVFYNDGIIKEYFEMYGADGTHWTIDYNGVTMYFDEGEIADIGIGGMDVTVTFAEHPELFNEKYSTVPDAYIVSLPMKSVFYTDLDGDGSCEELIIYDRYDEDNNASVDICTADNSYSESFMAYSCEPYYIKTADSKHYLYLFTELETQMYLYVYDITGGTVIKVGEASVSPFYNDGISAVLTDPDRMHFDIFTDEAGGGVSEGNDIFAVGADGMPAQG